MDCSMRSQHLISKDIVSSMKSTGIFDLKGFLELLQINNDVSAQVKLFSTLSAYLMSNEANIDTIITYNSLYDKICNVLSNCPPRKAAIMFNFLSALLYSVNEDSCRRKSLVVYAKNMIRSSGCLATMSELFTSCMMHQDVWRSLCRCLAEACRGIEANQSYCTHLVPMCVQRCSQRNIEVFLVLQSLLQNHARNVNLFIECNGISIFKREFLQHDVCLQLLSILVQSSPQIVPLINESDVHQHLRNFLHSYGSQSQLGQWATIILYYLTGSKGTSALLKGANPVLDNKPCEQAINEVVSGNADFHSSVDTTRFFQNVMKEIIQCGPPNDFKYLQGLFPAQPLNTQRSNTCTQQVLFQNQLQSSRIWKSQKNVTSKYNISRPEKNILFQNAGGQNSKTNNLSFSFLQKQNSKMRSNVNTNCNTADKMTESLQRTAHTSVIDSRRSFYINESYKSINKIRDVTPDLVDFEPIFSSTPKKNSVSQNERRLSYNRTRKSIQHSMRRHQIKRRIEKKNIPKRQERSMVDKEIKHRSISGWFFEAINESCTNLVKTVKNIFRPKISLEETKAKSSSSISEKDSSSCSYSFTNYMRNRDAILKNECTKKSNVACDDFSMEMSHSCNTCNDTVALKHKLDNDEHLKQTVRKLKLGINLYGCDFKRISKQLWPQQTYMTPVVLYNLYRKLIIK